MFTESKDVVAENGVFDVVAGFQSTTHCNGGGSDTSNTGEAANGF